MSKKHKKSKEQPRYPLLYLAYGANTQIEHMKHRCPTALPVGVAELHDYKLVFRSVADVVESKGSRVVVAVWEIMLQDERALDAFEGYPRLYVKRYAEIRFRGKRRIAMFYIMAGERRDQYEPPFYYEQTLREGYAQFGMDLEQIERAKFSALRAAKRISKYNGKWLRQSSAEQRTPKPEIKTDFATRRLKEEAANDEAREISEQLAADEDRLDAEYFSRMGEQPDWFYYNKQ